MGEGDEDQMLVELRMLGRSAVPATADPDRMAAAVVAALPTTRHTRLTRRRLAVAVVALLLALLATPPVRAAVADWLGFGGVRVELGEPRDGGVAPPPSAVLGGPDVEEAAGQVTFPVLAPRRLGSPSGVEVAPDGRMVSMTWTVAGSVVRLDQFDGMLDFAMAKRSPEVQYAAVGPVDALWFEEPHEVVILEPDGSRREETARLAGHTLIWPHGSTTLRLEGELSLEEAVAIGKSARPVG